MCQYQILHLKCIHCNNESCSVEIRPHTISTYCSGQGKNLHIAAAQKESGVEEAKKQVTEVADNAKGSLQQLLGIRGASESTNIWKIRLQLTKPVTWVPLIWGKEGTK